jgi:hypothetical protein
MSLHRNWLFGLGAAPRRRRDGQQNMGAKSD